MNLAKKLHQVNILLMQNLTNAIFPRNQKSHQAQSLYIINILIRALYVSIFFLFASHLWSSSQNKTIQFAKILLHKTVLILTLCKIEIGVFRYQNYLNNQICSPIHCYRNSHHCHKFLCYYSLHYYCRIQLKTIGSLQ